MLMALAHQGDIRRRGRHANPGAVYAIIGIGIGEPVARQHVHVSVRHDARRSALQARCETPVVGSGTALTEALMHKRRVMGALHRCRKATVGWQRQPDRGHMGKPQGVNHAV